MNGNLIANSGFIAQFATTTDSTGAPILAASVLTAIGTIQSVGQIIGMTTLPLSVPICAFTVRWACAHPA
jgi:hypothetical protein